MNWKVKTVAAVLGVLIVGYLAWGFLYPSASWRYRLTLEVYTPEGVKTGSSVIEVGVSRQPKFTPESGSAVGVRGEAVVVDLGDKGTLFALLANQKSPDYAYRIVFEMFPFKRADGLPGGETTAEGIEYYSQLHANGGGGKREVPPESLPTFVRFRNIIEPASVELVSPHDLAKSFGTGVQLKSATIEMVDPSIEPVTREINKTLTWLGEYYDVHLDGNRIETIDSTNRLANSLSSGSFSAGAR